MTVTLILIGITCVVSWLAWQNVTLLDALIMWPPGVHKQRQWYRLLSYGFVHANFTHLLFNMVTLYFFGRIIEGVITEKIGVAGYLLFYLGGIIASILPSYGEHREDENYRSLGASGAVSAVLFAFILFQPWAMIYVFFVVGVPAIVYAALYVGYTIWANLRGGDGVNHSAHLWGGAYGVAFVLVLRPEVLSLFFDRLMHPGIGG
jgi:membrane associated rhomboid family serine protease